MAQPDGRRTAEGDTRKEEIMQGRERVAKKSNSAHHPARKKKRHEQAAEDASFGRMQCAKAERKKTGMMQFASGRNRNCESARMLVSSVSHGSLARGSI